MHDPCLHKKELWALHAAYNFTTDTQIIVDYKKNAFLKHCKQEKKEKENLIKIMTLPLHEILKNWLSVEYKSWIYDYSWLFSSNNYNIIIFSDTY